MIWSTNIQNLTSRFLIFCDIQKYRSTINPPCSLVGGQPTINQTQSWRYGPTVLPGSCVGVKSKHPKKKKLQRRKKGQVAVVLLPHLWRSRADIRRERRSCFFAMAARSPRPWASHHPPYVLSSARWARPLALLTDLLQPGSPEAKCIIHDKVLVIGASCPESSAPAGAAEG
jgi:hypothetical protein